MSMHEKNCYTFAVCYSVSLGRPTSVFGGLPNPSIASGWCSPHYGVTGGPSPR